jgi:hypothetical protein
VVSGRDRQGLRYAFQEDERDFLLGGLVLDLGDDLDLVYLGERGADRGLDLLELAQTGL